MSQGFAPEAILSSMPSYWSEIYPILTQESFVPTLVGGSVRDFILTGILGKDWDIELTHPSASFNKDAWKGLGKKLSKVGKVSYLSYEIIRLEVKSYQFEFSPPRKETFLGVSGHSNFTAEFDFKLPFSEAIERRDFTINAIGIRFLGPLKVEFLDPLNGLLHLRDKILCPAGKDFIQDPVRFLRAIRFMEKMGLELTTELKERLSQMKLEGMSPTYVWLEMQKSGKPLNYLRKLNEWKLSKPELRLPLILEPQSSLWDELNRVLADPQKHEGWMVALEWSGIKSDSWQSFFSLGAESGRRLARWAEGSKQFTKINPEIFHGEFDAIRELPEFTLLFDWYFTTKQILQKHPDLPLMSMIAEYLPEWIHLYRFEAVKDVKHIDPPLRAKYQVWNLCQRL